MNPTIGIDLAGLVAMVAAVAVAPMLARMTGVAAREQRLMVVFARIFFGICILGSLHLIWQHLHGIGLYYPNIHSR
ncbi:MAG: hypothetical protein HYX28_07170 [Candidatus Koribacter versatilis]|uniref:Uncharacterized protein n=1 Tax=Candidatus Korobacter versatilis TaxID=658062 RepID=A0A932A898_9BACT|nr:hypothetical protein [Candidatus Koribacter versatilis]